MRLKNKTALITGAGSGIGQATAILFAREGARVVCVDINKRAGENTVALIRQMKHDALFIQTDVSSSQEVQNMAQECVNNVKGIDILFNNAGGVSWQTFETTTEEVWSCMIGTNLTGVFLCSKFLLPLIKAAGGGSIINHASIDAFLGNPNIAAYSAAKGGLIPLTHVMAHNLAKYNIRVNCLCTGGVATGIVTQIPEEVAKRLASMTPLGRMGTPDEVAHAALFFASEDSSFITGANLVVDGGRTGITQGTF